MIALRPVGPADLMLCYRLACDPVERAMSFTTARPTWADHGRWFDHWLADPQSLRWVILSNHAAAGVVWCRKQDDNALLSITLNRLYRGRGIGPEAIRLAVTAVRETWEVPIVAEVKTINTPSRTAFERAGFTAYGERDGVIRYHTI